MAERGCGIEKHARPSGQSVMTGAAVCREMQSLVSLMIVSLTANRRRVLPISRLAVPCLYCFALSIHRGRGTVSGGGRGGKDPVWSRGQARGPYCECSIFEHDNHCYLLQHISFAPNRTISDFDALPQWRQGRQHLSAGFLYVRKRDRGRAEKRRGEGRKGGGGVPFRRRGQPELTDGESGNEGQAVPVIMSHTGQGHSIRGV